MCRRWKHLTCIAAVAIATLSLHGCRRSQSDANVRTNERPNVLLITLDTTRADHLGCYGHPDKATPYIDALAEQGVRFEQMTCAAPVTLPSHATILTGLDPYAHGVRDNGTYTLDDAHTTLVESFKNAGYATGAQIAAPVLSKQYGLSQGFDDYIDPDAVRDEPINAAGCRLAAGIADQSIAWIRDHRDQPFFFWAHFFDPHRTYDPPGPFDNAFAHSPYLGEIAYVDEHVGRLIAELDALGLGNQTVVILTTDHGEGLGEHGEPTHSYFLYETTVAGALIVRYPAELAGGIEVSQQVRSVDIAPTILSLSGLEPMDGVHGVDLGPLLRGDETDWDLAAYSETFASYYHVGYAQARALTQGGWKYIHLNEPELYDLRNDPKELDNLAARMPERAAGMRERLRRRLESAPVLDASTLAPTSEDIDRLRSLGYLGNSAVDTGTREIEMFDPMGPDAKNRHENLKIVDDGLSAMSIENFAEAERQFARLVERDPENLAFRRLMLQSLAEQGKHQEALEAGRALLSHDADDVIALHSCGLALGAMGRHEEAVPILDRAVRLSPHDDRIAVKLGASLMALNRLDEANAVFERAVRMRPVNVKAIFRLAVIAQTQKRIDDAIDWYTRLLRLTPDAWQPNNNLAILLAQKSQFPQAAEYFRRAVEANPADAAIRMNLGTSLVRAGKPEEARSQWIEALRIANKKQRTGLINEIRKKLNSIQ